MVWCNNLCCGECVHQFVRAALRTAYAKCLQEKLFPCIEWGTKVLGPCSGDLSVLLSNSPKPVLPNSGCTVKGTGLHLVPRSLQFSSDTGKLPILGHPLL